MKRTLVPHLAALMGAIALPALMIPAGARAQSASSPAVTPSSQAAGPSDATPSLPTPMSEKVEKHIEQLHDQLEITTAEEPSWHEFALVMRDNAAQMERALTQRGANLSSMNATETMQSYAQLAQLHATNMQKLASTFQTLYNSFPSSQKMIADNVFRTERHQPHASAH
jgi:protein CpxP